MTGNRSVFTRRAFLGTTAATAFGASLSRMAAAAPLRTLDQIKHVVILMQENRSFDHYYGTMRGVRGFGDRSPVRLPNGNDVFRQPAWLIRGDGELQPWHLDTTNTDSEHLASTLHDWDTTHFAWNQGRYDSWVPWKGQDSLGYFTRDDVPYHHALAEAFTICDHYHCSIQGPTLPNRLYHWTGTIDPRGEQGGPATYNPHDYTPVYSWTTYPERLQKAGISWQVYANDEVGNDSGDHPYAGDYGDNPLWLFHAYHNALRSSDPVTRELAERAGLHTEWKPDSGKGYDPQHAFAKFVEDCKSGTLPAVSWVVAPFGYCEHPDARPVDGEVGIQTVLDAIWANESLWPNTAVLINYDENDGLFDHLPPPVAPPGTPDESLPCIQPLDGSILPFPIPPWAFGAPTPIGLGHRVPMMVVSPWSMGGWVNSQVFDHTSVLQFLEAWTGVRETNISKWRRQICGDLLTCFDFDTKNTRIPQLPDALTLRAKIDAQEKKKLPPPTPPADNKQIRPTQEPGTAPARALPYQPNANVSVEKAAIELRFTNQGTAALQLATYPYHDGGTPTHHDIEAGGARTLRLPNTGPYDLATHGPNGFFVQARGDCRQRALQTTLDIIGGPKLLLTIVNTGAQPTQFTISGTIHTLQPGESTSRTFDPLTAGNGWYDIEMRCPSEPAWIRRYRGHLENGQHSRTQGAAKTTGPPE